MRARRSTRAGALAALAAVLASASPTAALDVKVWPLFRWTAADDGSRLRVSALGPLFEYEATADERDLRVRPLLWLVRRGDPAEDDRLEVLYPLAGARWRDDYRSARVLLFTRRTHPAPGAPPDAAWESRTVLFPFLFHRSRPGRRTGFGLFPLYLDMEDLMGWDRVRAVLFPLYLQLDEPRVTRRFFPFPFVSTVGGPGGRGVRLFPFWGTKEIAGRERTRYVLWPFHIRQERRLPGYGWERRRVSFPVFAAIDGPLRTHRSWGVAARTHTIDRRTGSEAFGAPWPFWFRERALGEESWRTWRLVPIYGRSDRDGLHSRFWAWPALRWKMQDADGFHYERTDVLAVVWRRQTLASAASGRRETLTTLFPAYRSEEVDGRRFGQAPALVDALMPKNRGVGAMWAPLWRLVGWDTGADGSRDWSLLWGLVERRDGRLEGPWHLRLGDGDGG